MQPDLNPTTWHPLPCRHLYDQSSSRLYPLYPPFYLKRISANRSITTMGFECDSRNLGRSSCPQIWIAHQAQNCGPERLNPTLVKPFRLTYLAKGGGGCCQPPLEVLTIACLTFWLLLTDRLTLGLPEYKLKAVNICKMHGTGGLEVVVL